MTLPARQIRDVLISHAMSLGVFDRVNGHEPKNAPGSGLTCAFLLDRVDPTMRGSGLSSASARLVFSARIYSNAFQEPMDDIDLGMVDAVDVLLGSLMGDFDLGGYARNVDVFGENGINLQAIWGYADQDGRLFRIATVNVPVVINDAWDQAS